MPPLSRISDLFQSRPRVTPSELLDYQSAVQPVAQRLRALYSRWRQDLEVVSRDDELANAASIQRWEAAGLLDRLKPIQPPAPFARAHADLEAIVNDTARASQLLSNGYRFCSSRARCDGHALMLTAQEGFDGLCRSLSENGVDLNGEKDDRQANLQR